MIGAASAVQDMDGTIGVVKRRNRTRPDDELRVAVPQLDRREHAEQPRLYGDPIRH